PQASEPWFDVRATGLRTLMQDLGRSGQTRMGVSRSGALDRGAVRDANRIVGNPGGAPVLENLLGGLQLRCHGRVVLAVTGADAPLYIVTSIGGRVPAQAYQPLALDDGDTLHIGPPRAGTCFYVAVRGAWDVSPVLGSCATDTLAGIGPAPLAIGDALAVGQPSRTAVLPGLSRPFDLPRAGDVLSLDVILGPRADWFTDQALEHLAAQEWTVTPQSDRVGMRLAGAHPLARNATAELPSEGAVVGAIQVPANGRPVLFLADHPLTGGYPVIGAVAGHDLDRAAQMPVGARVRFRPIGPFKEIQP
ncbi:MAG: biotin-dependent carboxyltransferase family protein, partial [Alcaligenaceae bacterium]|nr:biotin-dependent carboxyltransferase family protein [Alcaligenaceae bacterium]